MWCERYIKGTKAANALARFSSFTFPAGAIQSLQGLRVVPTRLVAPFIRRRNHPACSLSMPMSPYLILHSSTILRTHESTPITPDQPSRAH